jgi:hypothetical protein
VTDTFAKFAATLLTGSEKRLKRETAQIVYDELIGNETSACSYIWLAAWLFCGDLVILAAKCGMPAKIKSSCAAGAEFAVRTCPGEEGIQHWA